MFTVDEPNISLAWGKALLEAYDVRGNEISPLVLNIQSNADGMVEMPEIRIALDMTLKNYGHDSVQTVANTIFPISLWRISNGDRKMLFSQYMKCLPRILKLEPHLNNRGLYFERLIAFGRGPNNGNQLDFILDLNDSRKGVIRSKFQASIFDPERDHVLAARTGFPCLQHVSFVPKRKTSELSMNAFYATQDLFRKGYGNCLGLWRLGEFMAGEMGLRLKNLTCVVGVEKLGATKAEVADLVDVVRPFTI
ncbi:MAG TPA: hypothetical protein PKD24_04470 [Pyrinomonadaceae bacterium]|nr:hypothetical protein [Pyrinomonadaceae bacterium]HMP64806.1 hypothetical protein [Pyrinomonadaceae bacterium]